MGNIQVLTLEDKEKWDKIVCTFSNYDIYWLSSYVKSFKVHGDGEPLLFYYESQELKAINVVMRRDIADIDIFKHHFERNTYFDFSTVYGYGGWLFEGDYEKTEEMFTKYEKWCKENNIVSEFVRFHPVIKNQFNCTNFYDVVPLGLTVTMDLKSCDTIWNNISSKNRNMIRKAEKNNVKIYNGRSPYLYKKFIEIYNETMDRDNAENYYYFDYKFYDCLCNELGENVQLFYAELDGNIIAASIITFANKMMNYHLSGTKTEFRNIAPTNLLLYKTAIWGSKNGFMSFYLGGGVGSGEDSLYKFKKSFNRNDDSDRFYIGKRIHNKEVYKKLVEISNVKTTSYFPEYRG